MKKSKLPSKKADISHNANDFDFLYNRDKIIKCLQCGRCTASCPAARVFEGYSPREIMRRVQDGEGDDLVHEDVIWLCGQCYTCSSRCPRNNSPASIILDLRRRAFREGVTNPDLRQKASKMIRSLWERGVTVSPKLITQEVFADLVDYNALQQARSDLGLAGAETREIKIPDKALEQIRTILKHTGIILEDD